MDEPGTLWISKLSKNIECPLNHTRARYQGISAFLSYFMHQVLEKYAPSDFHNTPLMIDNSPI